jgi:hypothetical protein
MLYLLPGNHKGGYANSIVPNHWKNKLQVGSVCLEPRLSHDFPAADVVCLGSDPGKAAVYAASQLRQALDQVEPRLAAAARHIQGLLLEGRSRRARRVERRGDNPCHKACRLFWGVAARTSAGQGVAKLLRLLWKDRIALGRLQQGQLLQESFSLCLTGASQNRSL